MANGKKKWYFIYINGEKSVAKYLDKLTEEGVKHEDIKITNFIVFGTDAQIYYYHDKEIKE